MGRVHQEKTIKEHTKQTLIVGIYNIILVVVIGTIAYFVTPWALLGLIFGASTKDRIVIEEDGTKVTIEISDTKELPRNKIVNAINDVRNTQK